MLRALVLPRKKEATARAKPEVRCKSLYYLPEPHQLRLTTSPRPMLGRWILRPGSCLSLARQHSKAQCRASSAHIPGRISKGDDLGPTRKDDYQTFRIRKDKQAKDLPLPPLLDPQVLQQRSRFEQRKERPNVAKFTPLQKQLWENSFGTGHALSAIAIH